MDDRPNADDFAIAMSRPGSAEACLAGLVSRLANRFDDLEDRVSRLEEFGFTDD